MATAILIPQLGNEIEEAEITEWLVKVGDSVEEGQQVVLITTTKMSIEIEAPAAGKITSIAAEEGDLVAVGATVGEIE